MQVIPQPELWTTEVILRSKRYNSSRWFYNGRPAFVERVKEVRSYLLFKTEVAEYEFAYCEVRCEEWLAAGATMKSLFVDPFANAQVESYWCVVDSLEAAMRVYLALVTQFPRHTLRCDH